MKINPKTFLKNKVNLASNKLLKMSGGPKPGISKVSAVGAIGKTLIYLKLGDALMKPLGESELGSKLQGVTNIQAELLNQTLGRIPVVGDILRGINNAIAGVATDVFSALKMPNLSKIASRMKMGDPNKGFVESVGTDEQIQDPKWYGLLGMHKGFNIPGGYPKQLSDGASKLPTPTIVAHELLHNYNPDYQTTLDRAQQTYTLLKAVRGLSATEYDINDVVNERLLAQSLLYLYYTVKFCVRAAKTYSLVNQRIGDMLIDAKGLNPDDVRTNLAAYERYLVTMHNYIANNVPITGYWADRIKYLVEAVLPDYQNGKIATIHTFAFDNLYAFETSGDGHIIETGLTFNDLYTLSFVVESFNKLTGEITNSKAMISLIADYFGAFGSKAVWEDKDFPDYATPMQFKPASDTALEQLKNASYVNGAFVFKANTTAKWSYQEFGVNPTIRGCSGFDFGSSAFDPDDLFMPTRDNFTNGTAVLVLNASTGAGTNPTSAHIISPYYEGVAAPLRWEIGTTEEKYYDYGRLSMAISKHKDNYTEEESLDLIQFKAARIGLDGKVIPGANVISIQEYFVTNEFAINKSIVYTINDNSYDTHEVMPGVICAWGLLTDYIDNPYYTYAMFDALDIWAHTDWMPALNYTVVDGTNLTQFTQDPYKYQLWDLDDLGTLDQYGFATAIQYSNYSLTAAIIEVAGKASNRAANVQSVLKRGRTDKRV